MIILTALGCVLVPLLFGWWFCRRGGFRHRYTPLRSYYDEAGRYVEPYLEWRARRKAQ